MAGTGEFRIPGVLQWDETLAAIIEEQGRLPSVPAFRGRPGFAYGPDFHAGDPGRWQMLQFISPIA